MSDLTTVERLMRAIGCNATDVEQLERWLDDNEFTLIQALLEFRLRTRRVVRGKH